MPETPPPESRPPRKILTPDGKMHPVRHRRDNSKSIAFAAFGRRSMRSVCSAEGSEKFN